MRRSRFTDEEIIGILNEGKAGRKVDELCRAHGINWRTYQRWKAKFDGKKAEPNRLTSRAKLDDNKVEKVTRLRQLEGENRRLKQAVVELTLDKKALEDLLNQAW